MQTETKLAAIYADSLFSFLSVHIKKGDTSALQNLETIATQLEDCSVFLLNPSKNSELQIRKFFLSPVIPWPEKYSIFQKAFAQTIDPQLQHFFCLLFKRQRLEQALLIAKLFRQKANALMGKRIVWVHAACELGSSFLSELETALEKYFNSSVQLHFRVRPELLGGIWIRSGDILLDLSLTGRLKAIEQGMKQKRFDFSRYFSK